MPHLVTSVLQVFVRGYASLAVVTTLTLPILLGSQASAKDPLLPILGNTPWQIGITVELPRNMEFPGGYVGYWNEAVAAGYEPIGTSLRGNPVLRVPIYDGLVYRVQPQQFPFQPKNPLPYDVGKIPDVVNKETKLLHVALRAPHDCAAGPLNQGALNWARSAAIRNGQIPANLEVPIDEVLRIAREQDLRFWFDPFSDNPRFPNTRPLNGGPSLMMVETAERTAQRLVDSSLLMRSMRWTAVAARYAEPVGLGVDLALNTHAANKVICKELEGKNYPNSVKASVSVLGTAYMGMGLMIANAALMIADPVVGATMTLEDYRRLERSGIHYPSSWRTFAEASERQRQREREDPYYFSPF